mmetsp:Transcript_36060/g.102087  ORF Transcript_36060/g.102087 Transcript_36060/m.102087 type:complete len:245 (+) Transcript_36060:254-988(+)
MLWVWHGWAAPDTRQYVLHVLGGAIRAHCTAAAEKTGEQGEEREDESGVEKRHCRGHAARELADACDTVSDHGAPLHAGAVQAVHAAGRESRLAEQVLAEHQDGVLATGRRRAEVRFCWPGLSEVELLGADGGLSHAVAVADRPEREGEGGAHHEDDIPEPRAPRCRRTASEVAPHDDELCRFLAGTLLECRPAAPLARQTAAIRNRQSEARLVGARGDLDELVLSVNAVDLAQFPKSETSGKV